MENKNDAVRLCAKNKQIVEVQRIAQGGTCKSKEAPFAWSRGIGWNRGQAQDLPAAFCGWADYYSCP